MNKSNHESQYLAAKFLNQEFIFVLKLESDCTLKFDLFNIKEDNKIVLVCEKTINENFPAHMISKSKIFIKPLESKDGYDAFHPYPKIFISTRNELCAGNTFFNLFI